MNIENEKELYLLVMNAPIDICVLDAETLVGEIVNDSFIAIAGKPRETILGNFYWDTFAEVRQSYEVELTQVITKGKPYSADEAELVLIRHGREETVYVTFVYTPLKNDAGKVKKVAVWVLENTLQVKNRVKVEESEKFARTLFYNSPVAKLVIIGSKMIVREANEKMLEILDESISIIGKAIIEAVPAFIGIEMHEKYCEVIKTNKIYTRKSQRIEFLKNDISNIGYYDYIYNPLQDADGAAYGVIFTLVNVTDQVISRNKLEEAELSMRGAVELAKLSTWSIDVSTNGLTYSDRLIEWFGFDPAAQDYNEVIPILSNEDQKRVSEAVSWALNPNSGGIYDEIYTVIHPVTGKKRILHAQGKTVFDPEGRPVRMNGTAQDITIQTEVQIELENQVQQRTEEIGNIIKQLTATNEELEETNLQSTHSNQKLAQFAYVASHDLQEPLLKIGTFVELLEGKISEHLDEKSTSYIEKIKNTSLRMSKLIRDVLAYSSLPKNDVIFESVNLENIAIQAMEDYDVLMHQKSAKVSWNSLPVIRAIPLQMSQLIQHIHVKCFFPL